MSGQAGLPSNNMKRALIITAIVIVLAGLGGVAYLYYIKRSTGLDVTPTPSLPDAGEVGDVDAGVASSTPAPQPSAVSARLVKISAGPVVWGASVTNRAAPDASSTPETVVHFIERQSGNVYDYLVRASTLVRTSNRTLPGIQSAAWLPSASSTFVRYLSGDDFTTINTYALPADGSSGFFLAQNLADVSVASTSILTLASGVNGSVATVLRASGAQPLEAFSTPLTSIRASFAGKQYLVFTKPSSTLDGYAYLVAGGRFSRIAGPHRGLVALASPRGSWVLVSYIAGEMQMKLVNTTTLESVPLPVGTVADKCVWALDESTLYCGIPINAREDVSYPDLWYQGVATFNDRVWKIDVKGRFAQLVLDFNKETNASLDLVAPAVDPKQSILVFINKVDNSLWSYSL
jgi:hypothetical protein